MNKVEQYIENNWDKCIKENMQDSGDLIGLPYPYTVPAVGHFDEMYYWDTYFTNKGLEECNRRQMVKNNTDNMLYLVNRYGFMLNGNRTGFLRNSQPPFLSLMVRDVFDHYRDCVWLTGAYEGLLREYEFWQTKRMSPIGLNCYGTELADFVDAKTEADYWKGRTGLQPDDTDLNLAKNKMAGCESGWDFNPRWETEGYNYAAVDLNSLMYMFEKNMEYFSVMLKNGQEEVWKKRAEGRRELMLKYMDNGSGILLDYNFVKNKQSDILSAASFYPLYAGLAKQQGAAALVEGLNRLEAEYGILTCEKNDYPGSYQWDYPNGWACLQYIAIIGLDNYGYKTEAKRIAQKYTRLVERVFDETGNLWEKYNVVEGNTNVTNEYDMPPMMGWSAGVYLAAKAYIG